MKFARESRWFKQLSWMYMSDVKAYCFFWQMLNSKDCKAVECKECRRYRVAFEHNIRKKFK